VFDIHHIVLRALDGVIHYYILGRIAYVSGCSAACDWLCVVDSLKPRAIFLAGEGWNLNDAQNAMPNVSAKALPTEATFCKTLCR
jgi:hypothetical protein